MKGLWEMLVVLKEDRGRDHPALGLCTRTGGSVAHLSAASAVRVKTDTPTEVSWMKGMSLHPTRPKSHASARKRLASTGAHVTSSNTSPSARLDMKRLGTFLVDLAVQKVRISVTLPTSPTAMMSAYTAAMKTPARNSEEPPSTPAPVRSHEPLLDGDLSPRIDTSPSSRDMVPNFSPESLFTSYLISLVFF